MLSLKNIVKDYPTENTNVRALDGVSLDFRESEFVSILGPSGCGKTTLLNIIGGLDQYTSGDLIINGVSTKKYKDADWDTYRNHSIGFVFQSYNLIPHQTVLANVELALTLSGISPKERRARAIDALNQVGLGDQLRKKPNQMSGGQMQRVAIARALVNNPDILLADEPTGALDTQTSTQIMEILKKISEKKLIIMVTHNPELAYEYSNRIIKVLDGRVVDDSNPYTIPEEEQKAPQEIVAVKKKETKQKKSMSFLTALSLSLNNLMTKKARTFMTSFAGSIGIIGIALILSVSTGVNNYIEAVQRDTLSTYPLTIQSKAADYDAMLSAMTSVNEAENIEVDPNKIYVDDSLGSMMSAMSTTKTNNLQKFKQYIEEHYDEIKDSVSDIQYTYAFDLQIFTADGKTQVNPSEIFDNMGEAFAGMSTMMDSIGGFNIMSEMINNQDLLNEQYELVGEGSHWPENKNEIVLVVNRNNQISKMALYMLGVLDQSELEEVMKKLMEEGSYEGSHMEAYDISDFIGMEFLLLNTSDFYEIKDSNGDGILDEEDTYTVNDKQYPIWRDIRKDPFYKDEIQKDFVTENGTKLVISGIVRPREGVSATSISGTVGYTKALTDHILDLNTKSAVINQQKETPDYNVLSGFPFEKNTYTKENIHKLIEKLDATTQQQFYAGMKQKVLENPELLDQLVINNETFLGIFSILTPENKVTILNNMLNAAKANDPMGVNLKALFDKLSADRGLNITPDNFIKELNILTLEQVLSVIVGDFTANPPVYGLMMLCGDEVMNENYTLMAEFLKTGGFEITKEILPMFFQNMPDKEFAAMETILKKMAPQTDATLASSLGILGDAHKDFPASINFYAVDFESKEKIEEFIQQYNDSVPEEDKLTYTDIIGVMMASVTTIINAISYVLIAFVAISLIVSSIMIGIITYISVLERTKEIGILRAIGASKKDIRRVFNAETLIVGFVAGMIGILTTLFFNVIINIILYNLTEIANLKAVLPVGGAIILVLISMFLTWIAGLFPAGFAAKRNPVEALRSE